MRATLQAHIDTCPRCAAEFESTASQWSLGSLAVAAGRAAGPVTRGIRGRVAAAPPDDTVAGQPGDPALLPRSLPRIPGVVDLKPIGRGGMGVVYRGRDPALDRPVAVKVLPAWSLVSEAGRRRAEREALMLARLDHPNVVKVYGAGEADGVPYLIMEWVAGPTLQQRLRTAALPAREAATIGLALARALEQVHAIGIIHRDIKPANILLAGGDQAASAVPKLVDFGLARPEEVTQQLTRAEDVLGTPGFMAPEQTGLDPGFG